MAAIRYRARHFDATGIWYVIGSEQKTHLNECFSLSAALGDSKEGQCKHIDFGLMVDEKGKKLASREGAGGLESFVDQLKLSAIEYLSQRYSPGDPTLPELAEKIAISALIYTNFMQSRERNMEFIPDRMMKLDAQSGPYLQYTVVRLRKLLENLGNEAPQPISKETLYSLPPVAHKIIDMINEFPAVIASSAKRAAPHTLAEYLFKLSSHFNGLYSSGERMKDADENKKNAYRRIVRVVEQVVTRGLSIFNIQIPEKM